MTEFWDDILPRLLGVLAGLIVTWAAQRGVTLDAKEVTALFLAIYAIVHRAVTAGRNTVRASRRLRAANMRYESPLESDHNHYAIEDWNRPKDRDD